MSRKAKNRDASPRGFIWRLRFAATCLGLAALVLVARSAQLQVMDTGFLHEQAAARHLRVAKIPAHRGPITDRNGEPLAVSTPVDSIWVNPAKLLQAPDRIPELARTLSRDAGQLARKISRNAKKEFVYLERRMNPFDAAVIANLDIPGVHLEREYRRFYPAGEVTGHLIGFTNIDDAGQEGLELAFDNWLAGHPGKKRVLKDRIGQIIEEVEAIKAPAPGRELVVSLDLRIQYLAYRELMAAIDRHKAKSGSVVVLDVETGEVLAMVNQPGFNPNDRKQFSAANYRNRAITDLFEPGSTFKPLVIAAAINGGDYRAGSKVDTSPGYIRVGAKLIEDQKNHGRINLTSLLARSSNVGATKVALSLEPETLYQTLSSFGVGQLSSSGFPGESAGLLSHHENWRPISQATLGYGYGLSMTPLQLAQAYAVLAAGGVQRPVSLVRVERPPAAHRVISEKTADAVRDMLEVVVSADGTGERASVAGYRVAGKTGTARKFAPGGYSEDRYLSLFAGFAPVSRPRLAMAIIIDEPSAGEYYGGAVAAPLFSRIAAGSLRILAVPPDAIQRPGRGEVTIASNLK